MKVCLIQPPYYTDYSRSEECFRFELNALDACTDDLDLIIMPESCDIPCLAHSREENNASVARYNRILLDKVSESLSCHGFCQCPLLP